MHKLARPISLRSCRLLGQASKLRCHAPKFRSYASAPLDRVEDTQLKKSDEEGSITADSRGMFKMLLPLTHRDALHPQTQDGKVLEDHVMFLLHPRQVSQPSRLDARLQEQVQPLSYIASLIEAETTFGGQGKPAKVAFRGKGSDLSTRWAMSTDLGEFVQRGAADREFAIALFENNSAEPTRTIRVTVPSFEERTEFMRLKLTNVSEEIAKLLKIKNEADVLAMKSAKRFAFGGLAGLLVYCKCSPALLGDVHAFSKGAASTSKLL
jgi:hypothetical protein